MPSDLSKEIRKWIVTVQALPHMNIGAVQYDAELDRLAGQLEGIIAQAVLSALKA